MRFSIEILMSVAVITHEILVRFLFDYVGIHVSHNQIRISQVSHEWLQPRTSKSQLRISLRSQWDVYLGDDDTHSKYKVTGNIWHRK